MKNKWDGFKPKLIAIVGPTASGKSSLAIKLAKKLNGEIISADSRQVYRGLNIGTGKVPRDDRKDDYDDDKVYYSNGVRHHLIDVASPRRMFTVAEYQKQAKRAIHDILKRDKLPIVCGGTGFYTDALLYNYKLPHVPPQARLRKKLEKENLENLYQRLAKLDPARAKSIDRHNKRRLIRALEIVLTLGGAVPPLKGESQYDILKIGIKKTPLELKQLIKKRLRQRLRQGMVDEVKKLHQKGLSFRRLDALGLEYRYAALYLQGKLSKKEMTEILEREIYKYAKRQMTWFKRDRDICWVENYKGATQLVKRFLAKK